MTQSERRETLKQEFLKCYETVFNPDNSIRVCGRENCKKLIELAEELCPGVKKFGSKERCNYKKLFFILRGNRLLVYITLRKIKVLCKKE